MSKPQNPCIVTILDQEYRITCTADEKADLIESARYLDKKMQALKDEIGVVGHDRLAVIAALNITHELLKAQSTTNYFNNEISNRLAALGQKIEASLGQGAKLAL